MKVDLKEIDKELEKNPDIDKIDEKIDLFTHFTELHSKIITNHQQHERVQKFNVDKHSDELKEKLKKKRKDDNWLKRDNNARHYTMKKGKLIQGKDQVREMSMYSNWNGANVDPEDLIRHRELLDR